MKTRQNFHEKIISPLIPQRDAFQEAMSTEVHKGLSKPRKTLPPKYFYDSIGSALFDRITQLPEYYLTRTEVSILNTYVEEIADSIGSGGTLVELGSGSSDKIRLLLDEVRPDRYIAMDISSDHLHNATRQLSKAYPWLEIRAVCADYTAHCELPHIDDAVCNAFFPGSSIGNFEPTQALSFLKQVCQIVGKGGGLLIGVDLKKNKAILERAYNDSQGITAQFNKNILAHINRRLSATFNTDKFTHKSVYNEKEGRVEMHLVCVESHDVVLEDMRYRFVQGESIQTENSYKYSIPEFKALAEKAGYTPVHAWTDKKAFFSVHYLQAA